MIVCMSSGGLVVEAATRSPLILFSQPGSGGMMVVCRSWAPCRLRLCFEKTFVESSIGTCLQSTDPQSRVYLSSYLRGLCASTVLFPSAIFFTPNGRNNNRAGGSTSAPTNGAVIIYSRAPARPAVRDGPRALFFEARRGRVYGTGEQAVDQRCEFVRRAV
jgi:hypothetical protein